MIKNQAGTLKVYAFNRATGAPVLGDGPNITCKYQLNGGSRSAIADTNPTEQEDGFYLFDVTAAETNGITADYYPESSTSGVQVIVVEHNRYTVDLSTGSSSSFPSIVTPYPLAAYMASDVITYADLVYRLMTKRGIGGSTRELNMLQVAVEDAFTDLCSRANWRHYNRRITIETEAASDFTDAVFESTDRSLTVTAQSWPANAVYGEIVKGEERYKVYARNSNTVLVLSSENGPGSDFTSDVSWVRSSYALSNQIKKIYYCMDNTNTRRIRYVAPHEIVPHRRLRQSNQSPSVFTIKPSESYYGLMEIEISPVPTTSIRLEMGMVVRPRPLTIFEVSGTDGAYSSGDTTFTAASATFTSSHVGCVLRISATATRPKGRTQFDDSRVAYAIQVFIVEILSSTSVRVSSAFTATGSSKGWTVSDAVDINPVTMLAALEAIAWEKYCICHELGIKMLPAASNLAAMEVEKGKAADDQAGHDVDGAAAYDMVDYDGFYPVVNATGD